MGCEIAAMLEGPQPLTAWRYLNLFKLPNIVFASAGGPVWSTKMLANLYWLYFGVHSPLRVSMEHSRSLAEVSNYLDVDVRRVSWLSAILAPCCRAT